MSVTYDVVEYDGGQPYKLKSAYSGTLWSHTDALASAARDEFHGEPEAIPEQGEGASALRRRPPATIVPRSKLEMSENIPWA